MESARPPDGELILKSIQLERKETVAGEIEKQGGRSHGRGGEDQLREKCGRASCFGSDMIDVDE